MRTKLAYGVVAFVLYAAPAWAEAWDFILTNETGKTIKEIELSPSGASSWRANIVDEEVKKDKALSAGQRTTVHFDKATDQCRWDVKLTFTDNSSTVWPAINVCDNAFVTVRYNGSAPVFAAN